MSKPLKYVLIEIFSYISYQYISSATYFRRNYHAQHGTDVLQSSTCTKNKKTQIKNLKTVFFIKKIRFMNQLNLNCVELN